MSRLVLTGATGFLGAALLDGLDLDGAIALTRGPAPQLSARGIEVRPCDLGNPGELPEGCRIIHMAGKVDFSADGQKAMLDLHVEATRGLAAAALKAKCTKFVLLSSSGTTAVSKAARELDEQAPYPLEIVSRWPYYLSKLYQERLVLDLHRREGLPVVVLNPSLLLGPGDVRGGSTQVVTDFLDGKILVAPAGGIGIVDVRDVARATVAALESGRIGERYFLGSWNTPFATFFEVLARIADKPAPALTSPRGFAPVGARVLSAVLGKQRTEAMSPAKMEMAEHFWYVNWSKATAELGFAPRRPEATLRDTVADIRRTP
ncbi:MAG: NAD-dependent epimerase/dehydratase [Cyanobacteria bacterium RYN_339]|nr:NAD-dependent epimerase/dehydratase [Cyanobacteria bacterium RYN_339]